jgi:hypothetical protein
MSNLSVQSPEDLVNLTLSRIGYALRIGSIYEGSKAAKLALTCYSQTRDEVLRSQDWGFAGRDVVLTLQKQAPPGGYGGTPWTSAYPMLPWLFQYNYPNDALKIRAVKNTPVFIPDFDPQYNTFGMENDNTYNPPQRVILCNVPNAICLYTGQITNPIDWEPDFIEAFAAALGRRLAPVLMGLEATKLAAADEQQEAAQGMMQQG